MISLSNEVKRVLAGAGGTVYTGFRCERIRNGAVIGEIAIAGTITLNNADSIGRSGRFTIYEPLDWLQEELKPYMRIRMEDGAFAEFPLGVFIPSTNRKTVDQSGAASWEVSGYDRTLLLRQDCIIQKYFIPAGTNYLDAVQDLLISVGVENAFVTEDSPLTIPINREFARGTNKLEIVNTLLSEINYNRVYCDVDGAFVISPYTLPTVERVSVSYKADEWSVIGREISAQADYYNTPNVFLCTVSNPDLEEPIEAEYINDDVNSPLSTVNRGIYLVTTIDGPEVVSSKEQLEGFVRRKAFELSQVAEQITFSTACMPHGAFEIVALTHPEFNGVYEELSWTMELSAGAGMTHTARRITSG